MGRALHHQAIFKCSWLPFVGVTQQIAGLAVGGEKTPLHARGKTRATTAAQARGLHFVDDRFWFHLQGFAQYGVAAVFFVALELLEFRLVVVFAEQAGLKIGHGLSSQLLSFLIALSGVRFSRY